MGDGRISVIDVAAKKVVATIDAGARAPNRLKFTTDGKLALLSEIGGGGLVVVDTTTRSVVKRVPLGRGASGILIPPGGTRAYVALTGDNAIAVIDLTTLTEVGRLSTGSGPDGMAWLAVSSKIIRSMIVSAVVAAASMGVRSALSLALILLFPTALSL